MSWLLLLSMFQFFKFINHNNCFFKEKKCLNVKIQNKGLELTWLFLINFYWSIFSLQCCISFYHSAKWISYCCLVTKSCPHDFVTTWTVSQVDRGQAPLSMGFPHTRILAWVVISFSRGSPQPRDWTCVSSWQMDSLLLYVYVYPFFFGFPSHLGHQHTWFLILKFFSAYATSLILNLTQVRVPSWMEESYCSHSRVKLKDRNVVDKFWL